MPNTLNSVTHFRFNSGHNFCSVFDCAPNHTAWVLSKLMQRPEQIEKSFNTDIASISELSVPSRSRKVSSAYCAILIVPFKIDIPLIFSFFIIFLAKGSIAKINIYGLSGSPCLQDL